MARAHSKTMLAFGDVHIPHQNPQAVEMFCRAAERLRPDLIVCLGDLLDCGQFSTHPPRSVCPRPSMSTIFGPRMIYWTGSRRHASGSSW